MDIVAPKSERVQGMQHYEKGDAVPVDHMVDEVVSDEYAGLVLPGGVANPDALRLNGKVVAFVREFSEAKKPVAAICHAPWTLIEADVVRGRTLTSWPSLKTDLKNAGATRMRFPPHLFTGRGESDRSFNYSAYTNRSVAPLGPASRRVTPQTRGLTREARGF